jgi:hypothetical protein
MAKGQKRGNREIRKPKAEKPAKTVAPTTFSSAIVAAGDRNKKKS